MKEKFIKEIIQFVEMESSKEKFVKELTQFMEIIDEIDKTVTKESNWWLDMMDIRRKCVNFKMRYTFDRTFLNKKK